MGWGVRGDVHVQRLQQAPVGATHRLHDQRRLRLVLPESQHLPVDSQMAQEGHHLGRPHILWMALAVKQDESVRPIDISLFRANAVMARAQVDAQAAEQFGLPRTRSYSQLWGDRRGTRGHPCNLRFAQTTAAKGLPVAVRIFLALADRRLYDPCRPILVGPHRAITKQWRVSSFPRV